jgi:hypothetical protein
VIILLEVEKEAIHACKQKTEFSSCIYKTLRSLVLSSKPPPPIPKAAVRHETVHNAHNLHSKMAGKHEVVPFLDMVGSSRFHLSLNVTGGNASAERVMSDEDKGVERRGVTQMEGESHRSFFLQPLSSWFEFIYI